MYSQSVQSELILEPITSIETKINGATTSGIINGKIGDTIDYSCIVKGGIPRPQITVKIGDNILHNGRENDTVSYNLYNYVVCSCITFFSLKRKCSFELRVDSSVVTS